MSDTVVFVDAAEIVTCAFSDERAVLRDSALVVRDGVVAFVGPQQEALTGFQDARKVDCRARVLTPGFVDSHTHAVFGNWRSAEYEMRSRGLDYMEIARKGGGINASVSDVRSRSAEELEQRTLERLQLALAHGTTTIEIKSGYGLSLNDELKLLRVARNVAAATPLDVAITFLGAHDIPIEFRQDRAAYVRLIVDEMIPAVADEKLAGFCDVFMEPGAFTGEEARAILEAGSLHGLTPKLHADEFVNSGGAELAAALDAASADHLGAISDRGIEALARSSTVATLLPATLFFLGKKSYAPARKLIDSGVTVALATDFNPGTAPSASMPLVLTMACSQMQMTPLEALIAATVGGARALRLASTGALTPGARADVVVWDVTNHGEIPYRFGAPPVAEVWKAGKRLV